MPRIIPRDFNFWPEDKICTPDEVIAAYNNKFVGVWKDPEAQDELHQTILDGGGVICGSDAIHDNGLAESGKDRLVIPFVFIEKFYAGGLPGAAQEVGDCFVDGTTVLMADGSRKPIEQVKQGEQVISAAGQKRTVVSTISKPYSGDILTLSANNVSVSCTPDHRFLCDSDWWTAANVVKHRRYTNLGRVDHSVSKYSGKVHCIGVDEDHSFLANDFAVHNCVSHSTKNGCLVTMVCDIASGKPDEETGIVEGAPEISALGIQQGVLSSEANYWYRGYNGHGWSCSTSANVAIKKSAMWLRQNYPELGVSLEKYSGSLASKYGAKSPPPEFTAYGQKHLIRTATELDSFEEIRDMLANGYGISSCGSEGYSSSRDENGVSKRSGSWAHAMAIIGADDRPEIRQIYGEPLILIQNSWGKWNTGPRRIKGTEIDIPHGAFWVKWSHARNRYFVAFSGANGWPSKKLPSFTNILG